MGILFAFLTALSFAVGNIVIKKGITRTNGENNGFLITVTMNVILLGLFYFIASAVRGFTFHFSWKALFVFMSAGLLTSGLGRYTLFAAIGKINPSRASALKNAAPIFTILFALLILGERLTWIEGAGILLLLGAISIQGAMYFKNLPSSGKNGKNEKSQTYWTGYGLAVLAALIFGAGQGIRKQGLLILNDAFFGAWVGSLTAFCFIIIYESLKGRLKTTVEKNRKTLNGYFIASGTLTTTGPLCFFIGASLIQVSFVSVIAAIEPLLTILLSALFLKKEEELSLSVWLTAALVLTGTIVIAFAT
ncbi:MAG TPA: EamA family transporter [Bacillales bacterium]|nr:EamA family transporter [Bacillales bacterium]